MLFYSDHLKVWVTLTPTFELFRQTDIDASCDMPLVPRLKPGLYLVRGSPFPLEGKAGVKWLLHCPSQLLQLLHPAITIASPDEVPCQHSSLVQLACLICLSRHLAFMCLVPHLSHTRLWAYIALCYTCCFLATQQTSCFGKLQNSSMNSVCLGNAM